MNHLLPLIFQGTMTPRGRGCCPPGPLGYPSLPALPGADGMGHQWDTWAQASGMEVTRSQLENVHLEANWALTPASDGGSGAHPADTLS